MLEKLKAYRDTVSDEEFRDVLTWAIDSLVPRTIVQRVVSKTLNLAELMDLREDIKQFPNINELPWLMLGQKAIRKYELQVSLDYDKEQIDKLIHWMTKFALIESSSIGYRKRDLGVQFFHYLKENPIGECND